MMTGNRWRTSLEKFDITDDTILEFTFSSDQLGEIQGIGFSENDRGASQQIFKLTGTQNWGIQDIHYQGGTQRMTIPVGQYYTGSNMRLVFVNDNDAAPTSTSTFSHVHVCKTICTDGMIDPDKGTGTEIGTETSEPQAQVGYFVHSDHLATPYMLTDNTQQVVWRIENQTPFGEGQINSDPDGNGESIEFNLRFPGQYFDSETGTNYNYFRDYDPSLGRYVQSDPIGLDGGLNTYGYALQNPLRWIDPLGLTVSCTYDQASGQLRCTDDITNQQTVNEQCYSGAPGAVNDGSQQNTPHVGPIPSGDYDVGSGVGDRGTGPQSLSLTPTVNNNQFPSTRDPNSFLMHGDNSQGNQSASQGCIICPRNTRNTINNSGGGTLTVQ